jgi:hypothetical protein
MFYLATRRVALARTSLAQNLLVAHWKIHLSKDYVDHPLV